MQSLTTYIQNPDLLDTLSTDELRMLVDRYPAFQAARLLYLRGLYLRQDERFGAELRKAALFVPDRRRLFELIEGEKYRITSVSGNTPTTAEEPLDTTDRTQSLISSFLAVRPEVTSRQGRRPRAADAAVDYISFLAQQEEEDVPNEAPSETPAKVLTGESAEPVATTSLTDEDENDTNDLSDALFTETLARIYIKQGKYLKAIEIIRRLSLNFPKKNRYFADQIRFLEKLIINEQLKNASGQTE